jgi:transcriptional regulator with XRE-family HTH domain
MMYGQRSMREARTFGQVVGANVQRLREAQGWTQEELARRLRAFGLHWTRANLASVESGRRQQIDLASLVLIALAMDAPASELLAGDPEEISVGGGTSVNLHHTREWLAGRQPLGPGYVGQSSGGQSGLRIAKQQALRADGVADDADERAALRLGLTIDEVLASAKRLWGRTLTAERDARAAKAEGCERTAVRGHITRQLMTEIEEAQPRERQGRR